MSGINYSCKEHLHNYACWTSAAATRMSAPKNLKLTNNYIIKIIDQIGLIESIDDSDYLLNLSATEMDSWHYDKREAISKCVDKSIYAYHGLFAKIINIYLKTTLLCNLDNFNKAINIHPPIDGFLLAKWGNETEIDETKRFIKSLKGYYRKLNGVSLKTPAWSKLTSEDYNQLIKLARKEVGEKEPLWKLEYYWTLSD